MSFSSDLKTELYGRQEKALHCRIAELSGIISVSGRVTEDGAFVIRVDGEEIESKVRLLIRQIFDDTDGLELESGGKHHRRLVVEESLRQKIYATCKVVPTDSAHVRVQRIVTERSCCKKAYIRGVYLAGGSMSNPEKAYQLEISVLSEVEAGRILSEFSTFGIEARYIQRGNRFVVYIKDGDAVAGVLGLMGATGSLMDFENARILRGIRGDINREVNCDTANIAKTTKAAGRQIEDIRLIEETVGLDSIDTELAAIARVRMEYPIATLAELGSLVTPKIGKSGVSHRLRRISDIAAKLRDCGQM